MKNVVSKEKTRQGPTVEEDELYEEGDEREQLYFPCKVDDAQGYMAPVSINE